MTGNDLLTLLAFLVVVAAAVPVLGRYLARVYAPEPDHPAPGERVFAPVERAVYRLCGVNPDAEQRWSTYARSLLAFGLVSWVVLYALLRLQSWLPLNPTGAPAMPPALAFNTAVSFVTNTNWQAYSGGAVSYLTAMLGLTTQNVVSAATGMAVAVAIVRGITRRGRATLGNFWVDLTRSVVRVLLPMSLVLAFALAGLGVVQNLAGDTTVRTVEGAEQVVPGGPAASQVAVKQLGSNGGGFFAANSAHPFENPNAVTELLELLGVVLIPLGMAAAYGRLVGDPRQGRVLVGVMVVLWAVSMLIAVAAETSGNPRLGAAGADQAISVDSPGGNLEGKEVRFGPVGSATWAASTTGTSNGSVNASLDSFVPAGGGIALLNMLLGEVSPGGVGVGLMGMLIFALLAVFIAGLMVGRTPEYLGKKIQSAEMRLVVLYIVAVPAVVLAFSAVSILASGPAASISNPGPHGLTQVLYAYGSGAANNGSAFAGLAADTTWFNTTIGLSMLAGRYLLIVPALAIGGSLARKHPLPATAGTFPTHTPLFGVLVTMVVLIVAGLTFFPALALGPVVEQLGL